MTVDDNVLSIAVLLFLWPIAGLGGIGIGVAIALFCVEKVTK